MDILLKFSLLSQYLALPREGHLEEGIHVMDYLKQYKKLRLMFDTGSPTFDDRMYKTYD